MALLNLLDRQVWKNYLSVQPVEYIKQIHYLNVKKREKVEYKCTNNNCYINFKFQTALQFLKFKSK